ncbi:MAG: HPr family phosphocarrier protein [Clostridia bacterium]|nr:HPr family phosphocarrier protein [Clostridia bacterium]
MKEFEYTIQDALGIHARPAGLLVKEAGKFQSDITLNVSGKSGDAKRIFSVMALAVQQGDSVKVIIEGSDEDAALTELKQFFQANL